MRIINSFTYKGDQVGRSRTHLHFADGNLWIDSGNISSSMTITRDNLSQMYKIFSAYEELLSLDTNDAYRDELTNEPTYFLVAIRFDELMCIELYKGDVFIGTQLPKEEMSSFVGFLAKELVDRYENEKH